MFGKFDVFFVFLTTRNVDYSDCCVCVFVVCVVCVCVCGVCLANVFCVWCVCVKC